MSAYADQLERELIVVGASAVEDELQDDVKGTLQSLREANIRVWMLTGDKLETAINIGYSSGLLTSEDKVLVLKPELDMVSEEVIQTFFRDLEKAVSFVHNCIDTGKKERVRGISSFGDNQHQDLCGSRRFCLQSDIQRR